MLESETSYGAAGAQIAQHGPQHSTGLNQSQIAAGTASPLLGSQTSYNASTSENGNYFTVAHSPIGQAGVNDLGSKNKAAEEFFQDTSSLGPTGEIIPSGIGSMHGHNASFDRKNDTKSRLDYLNYQYASSQLGSSQYDGFQDAPESPGN